MSLIEIDENKCKRDGLCVSECPSQILRMNDKGSVPRMIPGGAKACLRCGHCLAACPHGALNHVEIPSKASPPINKDLLVSPEQAVQFLRSRRSIRQYRNEPVEKEKIQRLIAIARYAPTGGNTELVEWWVFTDKQELRGIAEMTVAWMRHYAQSVPSSTLPPYYKPLIAEWDAGHDTILRDAPVLIVALTPAEYHNGIVDLTIALSYLQLAAVPLGLGTCWAGLVQRAMLHWQPLKETLGLPEKAPQHYPMMLGYPKIQYHRVPERKQPKIRWR
jgi:nitroreductase/NAD-dependent dihydropyrimidine dehydrogenase PreA subunit